jgi:hypothetical protein
MKTTVIIACVLGLAQTPTCADAQDGNSSITLTISEPQKILANTEITLAVRLKNVSDHKIPIIWGEPYTAIVHQKNGYAPRHKPGVWGTGDSSAPSSIGPGETLTEYVSLNEYDLVPGTYLVQALRPLHASMEATVLRSNEIEITVLPDRQDELGKVQVQLSSSTPVVRLGEMAKFQIQLTNRSNREISCRQMWVGTVNLSDQLDLLDAKGRWVEPRESGPGGIKSCTLAPGKSTEWEQDLVPSDYAGLELGSFTAQVSVLDPENPNFGVLHSNVVKLTIYSASDHFSK